VKSTVIAVVLCLLPAGIANAVPVTWNLSPLNFNTGPGLQLGQGGVATGSFTYDADTNTYSSWNIVITDFGFAPANGLLTPLTSSLFLPPSATSFALSYSSGQARLSLSFFDPVTLNPQPLTNSGGLVNVSASVVDAGNVFYSWFGGGTASSVPEPASASFVLAGGGALCAVFILLRQWLARRAPSA
jgi:hypothetical protein